MISNSRIKFIKSLQIKKFRKEHKLFLVEGAKSVLELLNSDYKIDSLYITESFHNLYVKSITKTPFEVVGSKDLERMGEFTSNDSALAVVNMQDNKELKLEGEEFILALDGVNDPGNLGTIIRIADWYGISKIICSENTAEVYNSKVISASMGSFTRVNLYYCSLAEYLSKVKTPVYGAELQGQDIHKKFASSGFIVLGSEASGVTNEVQKFITEKITIPRYGKAESLNVAVATAIICDNLKRTI